MKKLLTVILSLAFLTASMGFGQDITRIYDIQYTEDGGDSPLVDQEVTVSGIVTGESYAYGSEFFLQDSVGAWSGILVHIGSDADSAFQVGQGDSVTVTGTVSEYFGMTQIEASSVTIDSMWAGDVPPITVTSGEIATDGAMAEAYEGVLIKVEKAAISNADLGNGEWGIDDGSGEVRVNDNADYYFWPSEYDSVEYVIGPLNYSFNDTKIEPRLASDVVPVSEYTRIQRLQQVRGSDLARIGHVENDDTLDYTYYYNYDDSPLPNAEPFKIKGIVTMPTGLSYAGAGVKFIMQDHHGGPWSGILLYSPDSTTFPVLYEGDEVSTIGYVGEYSTDESNMTEFWVTGEVNITSEENPVPEPSEVQTGDLRWPTTAEQWGTVFVKLKDVIITENDYNFGEWGVDDGSGEVRIGNDSDSLSNFNRPPLGTVVDSITGWVYHHFGYYADSSTYKVEPLYEKDVVIGEGPPNIRNYARTPGAPTSDDVVTISADFADNSAVTSAKLFHRVNGGAYNSTDMQLDEGITYTGNIPFYNNGDRVDYFLMAEDDNGTSSTLPADTTKLNFSYTVASQLTISDIQYTPWELAQTPYEGVEVSVSGVVTADTLFNSNFEAYVIQESGATEWGGLFVFDLNETLTRDQTVTVFGTATDYNADFHFKWDGLTVILADSVQVGDTGDGIEPMVMTAADLEAEPEKYEGMLVRVNDIEVTALNQYDWSVTDASGGEILIDDDIVYTTSDSSWFASLGVGGGIEYVTGIWTYSFGSFKIELRDTDDHGVATSVEPDRTQPFAYSLSQNYPNPFNPTTNIQFSLADQGPVTIAIYNIRGQMVRALVRNQTMEAGYHTLNWDGTDKNGRTVGSGVYIYRIHAGDFIKAKKMTLLR
ncbi:MAG: T9SS type A sorting domain-containing protein [Candidatus Marinimicrobia bacterium]|nr:T9SS type A sorting domain-containing protein [Candidatus Neomarinimicrobiota bacterium]MCF7829078.1 T9SS type A sorting domain-containing protein [Candidatus Neomarinimicrobiota bacterium]MCF7881523.1 T9SS type A sorting domain-containing protein [Candidatus Neomarinimicrobiota bacterium]